MFAPGGVSRVQRLAWQGGDRWAVSFPYRNSSCKFRLGNCKCAQRAAGELDVMVGDGRSDFCIAERCQLVIAKGSLLRRCREQKLPHMAMIGFGDANLRFARWLAQRTRQVAPAPNDLHPSEMPEAVV